MVDLDYIQEDLDYMLVVILEVLGYMLEVILDYMLEQHLGQNGYTIHLILQVDPMELDYMLEHFHHLRLVVQSFMVVALDY